MNKYTFAVVTFGGAWNEYTKVADTEKLARKEVWDELTGEHKNCVESIDLVEEESK